MQKHNNNNIHNAAGALARRGDVNVDVPQSSHAQSDAIEVVVDDGDVDDNDNGDDNDDDGGGGEVATHNGKNIQEYKGKYNSKNNKAVRQKIKMGEKSFIHKVEAKRHDKKKEENRRSHAKLQEHVQKQR